MEKQFDVIAMGELLIDFTMSGQSEQGNNLFEACPGGAPCNVLALLNKMGKKTAFLGKVGKDQFGTLLRATLEDVGINTSNLLTDEQVNTTLAFVHTFPDGDREFSFYRNPGADMMLTAEEVDEELFEKLTDTIWEFRTIFNKTKYRLLSFWDTNQRALIIATHGFEKKTKKTPPKGDCKSRGIKERIFK